MTYQDFIPNRPVNVAAELSILPSWVTDETPSRTRLPLNLAGGQLRAWKYGRFSSAEQRVESLDRQSDWAEAYCAEKGMILVGRSDCLATSGNFWFDREGLEETIAAARSGLYDVLLIEHCDRIGRDLGIIGTVHRVLTDLGIEIHVTRLGRALDLTTLAMLAYEAAATFKMMVDRSADGHRRSARKGLSPNGACWGYDPVPGQPGRYVKDEKKCETVRWIYEMRLAGVSCKEIALALNARGIAAPKGGLWTRSSIWYLVQIERYCGVLVYGRTRKPKDPATGKRKALVRPEADHIRVELPKDLAVVDRETWLAVQPKRARPAHGEGADGNEAVVEGRAPRKANRRYLLSQLVRCHACDAPMLARTFVHGASALQCSTYFETKSCDNSRLYRMPEIEAATVGIVRRRLADPSLHAEYVVAYDAEWQRRTVQIVEDRKRLEEAIKDLTRKQGELFDLQGDGGRKLDNEQLKDLFLLFDGQKAAAKQKLAALPSTLRVGAATPERLRQLQVAFDRLFEACPVKGNDPDGHVLMEAFRDLVESVRVAPDPVGRGYQVAVNLRLRRTLHGTGAETETVSVSGLWGLTRPHRQKEVQADYDRAAESDLYRLPDGLWRLVRPLVPYQVTNPVRGRPTKVGSVEGGAARRPERQPSTPDARNVVDAMIFAARTGACIYRLPALFGERKAMRRAVKRCVYHDGWERIADLLDKEAPEVLAGSGWRAIKAFRKQPKGRAKGPEAAAR